ncbi:MAG: tetratricopeptide repeat protein [candidate division Zixibacteria bacterium]|nr:tetratricopeptide repeat protein [candidate division Zixibacteria bacterium]
MPMHTFYNRFKKLALILAITVGSLFVGTIHAENLALEEGKRLFDQEEFEQAKDVLLKVVEKEPENAEANFFLCKTFLILNDHDKSIKYGKKAVKLNDSVSEYHLWLGQAHVTQAQKGSKLKAIFRARRAKKEWEKAVSVDSTNVEARLALAQYLLMAPGIAGGDKGKAKKHIEIIQEIDSLFGAIAWSFYWRREKDTVKVENYLKQAVRLDTTSDHTATYLWGIFLQDQKKYYQAAEVFEKLFRQYPDEMVALYQVGRGYVLAEDSLDKAERCFKQYLQVEPKRNTPSWAAAHWRLGMVYDLQGKRDLAIAELEEAVRLDPKSKEFKKTLKKVKKKK